jgi:hypothetical protein
MQYSDLHNEETPRVLQYAGLQSEGVCTRARLCVRT